MILYVVASPHGARRFVDLGDALRFIAHVRRYDPQGDYRLGAVPA